MPGPTAMAERAAQEHWQGRRWHGQEQLFPSEGEEGLEEAAEVEEVMSQLLCLRGSASWSAAAGPARCPALTSPACSPGMTQPSGHHGSV